MNNSKYTTATRALAYIMLAATILTVEAFAVFAAYNAMLYLRPDDGLMALAAPVLFNVALWVYLGEAVLLAGNNMQRVLAVIGAIASLVATVYMVRVYFDLTSAVHVTAAVKRELSQNLLNAFEFMIGFHVTAHVLLILTSETVRRIMDSQARAFRIIASAKQKADDKTAAIEDQAADIIAEQDRDQVLSGLGKAFGVNLLGVAPRAQVPTVIESRATELPAPTATMPAEAPTVAVEPRKAQTRPVRRRVAGAAGDKPGTATDAESRGWHAEVPDATGEVAVKNP